MKYWTVTVWSAGFQPLVFSHDMFGATEADALLRFVALFPHLSPTSCQVEEVS